MDRRFTERGGLGPGVSEDSTEPLLRDIARKEREKRESETGVVSINKWKKEHRPAEQNNAKMEPYISDAERWQQQREKLDKSTVTERDFFENPAIQANNPIPQERLARMKEIMAGYTQSRGSNNEQLNFDSADECRADLIKLWNFFVRLSIEDQHGTVPSSMAEKSVLVENVQARMQELKQLEALEAEAASRPKPKVPYWRRAARAAGNWLRS
jgi:flagellar biosynthesis GTPase FlhF